MSIAITAEQRAIQQSIADATARAGTMRTVREPAAHASRGWRRHWPDLADIGLLSIALPEEQGGAGSGLDDQCAALEQAAYELVPGSVLPTVLAGVLLARQPETATAKELLSSLADGTETAAVGLDAGTLAARPLGAGAVVSGEVGVLGADPEAHLLLGAPGPDGEVWFVVAPGQPGVTVTALAGVDLSAPLGRVVLDRVPVPTDRQLPNLSRGIVTDLAATLSAAEAAGVARWCVDTAADYAKVRAQFGRPIGSFQAVKHLCAEMLCRAEQAAAVAWDAARAYDHAADQHAVAAVAAAAVALDAAVDNAKDWVYAILRATAIASAGRRPVVIGAAAGNALPPRLCRSAPPRKRVRRRRGLRRGRAWWSP